MAIATSGDTKCWIILVISTQFLVQENKAQMQMPTLIQRPEVEGLPAPAVWRPYRRIPLTLLSSPYSAENS